MNHHLAPIHCPLQRLKVLHVALRKSKFRIGQMLRKVPFPSRSQVVINRYRLDAVPSQQHIRKMRSNKPRAAHNKKPPHPHILLRTLRNSCSFVRNPGSVHNKRSTKRAFKPASSKENSVHAADKLMIVDSLPTVDLKTLRISPAHVLIEKRIPGA